jgi:hypothetical protein
VVSLFREGAGRRREAARGEKVEESSRGGRKRVEVERSKNKKKKKKKKKKKNTAAVFLSFLSLSLSSFLPLPRAF